MEARMSRWTYILLVVTWPFLSASRGLAKEYHVSPSGTARGNGSLEKPWDLPGALAQPRAVKPGDTLWLHGGRYAGAFTSRLRGQPGAPITVRQFPGERATIDCQPGEGKELSALFSVEGDDVVFWGFEVLCSSLNRITQVAGSEPPDINRGGINCSASRVQFINLIVHDTGQGFGFWSSGEGGQIYGCLIYNNGWKGPDRGHGHAIYTQNRKGVKKITDNLIFDQFGYGIHAYGSGRSFLQGYDIEGNIAFNNGTGKAPDVFEPNVHIGGGAPASGIILRSNYTYQSNLRATTARFGYGKTNADLRCDDNYFAGLTHFQLWQKLVVTGNTFVAGETPVRLYLFGEAQPANYVWDRNNYSLRGSAGAPVWLDLPVATARISANVWRAYLGLSQPGAAAGSEPKGVRVFVRPNLFEAGRAHVAVYNWDKASSVRLDLSNVFKRGDRFRIVSAQDYFGEPRLSGVYDAQPVELPMVGGPPVPPVGISGQGPPATEPEFGAFVVIRGSENRP